MWFIVTGSYSYFPDFAIALDWNGKIAPFDLCPDLTDGLWHSIAFTYNGAGHESLYVDNNFIQARDLFGMQTGYNTQGDEKNWLGTWINQEGSYENKFVGDLKDIAFYNYTLTDLQATTDLITE